MFRPFPISIFEKVKLFIVKEIGICIIVETNWKYIKYNTVSRWLLKCIVFCQKNKEETKKEIQIKNAMQGYEKDMYLKDQWSQAAHMTDHGTLYPSQYNNIIPWDRLRPFINATGMDLGLFNGLGPIQNSTYFLGWT